jgi:phosphate-selective porin OprO/OprP
VQILDAYVDIHPWEWLRLRVGKMKPPIGLERLQSDADLPFLERALTQNLSAQRDVGVQLWGDIAGGIAHYALGVFNGGPDNGGADTDLNHAKDFEGRIFFQPFKAQGLRDFGSLGVGIAAGTGNRKGRLPTNTGLSTFRTSGQNTFFQYLAPATDTTGAGTTFPHERATRINPELFYYYDWFGVLAEYLWLRQGLQRGGNTGEVTHKAAHVTVNVAINGRVGYDGVAPLVGFDPAKSAWGALELAARWGWIKADEASFGDTATAAPQFANPVTSARSARAFAGAVTWVPRRSLKLSVNFEQTRFEGGAGTAMAPTDRRTENVLIGRAQVNF